MSTTGSILGAGPGFGQNMQPKVKKMPWILKMHAEKMSPSISGDPKSVNTRVLNNL